MITRLRLVLPTLLRLGPVAVCDVAAYRVACRFGLYRRRLPLHHWKETGAFFAPLPSSPPPISQQARQKLLDRTKALKKGEVEFFSVFSKTVGAPPNWFLDPFSESVVPVDAHWSQLDEFSAGDVKKVWETSRFEWAPLMARAWRLTGDPSYIEMLNEWLLDWVAKNPANMGPNWKCGQEAGIRLINLLLAARLLKSHETPSESLIRLIALHCSRIVPTVRYAVAQNNNHGTSEAAALFVGGAWLAARSGSRPLSEDGRRWRDLGRHWLENRVTKLVAADGSFSQYSVNYHRVLLDTLCQAEFWRRELDEPAFSDSYTARCHAAVNWLESLTDPSSGDAPNMGANDGARLYNLSSSPYRDFRPTVQTASVLFRGRPAYDSGSWDEPLLWLALDVPESRERTQIGAVMHKDGGDLVLQGHSSRGIVRFASFRFRPSHADCLHVDLWHNGENILRDGGTYSYNTDPRWLEYYSGTESHNTIQFDDRNQMPRISRFLFGAWLTMEECTTIRRDTEGYSWTGAYTDSHKSRHRRTVIVAGNIWRIIDEVCGFKEKAVLRWRLIPGKWTLLENVCDGGCASLKIRTKAPVRRLELTTGWESLHYQQKTQLPVLEVEIGPGKWTVETEIRLKD